MPFIKLTLSDGTALHARADHITAVYRLASLELTRVAVMGKDHYEVQETPEQIHRLIRYAETEGRF